MNITITLEVADETMPAVPWHGHGKPFGRKCGRCGSVEFREVKSEIGIYILPRSPMTRSETEFNLHRSRSLDTRDMAQDPNYSPQLTIPMVICVGCNRLLSMQ